MSLSAALNAARSGLSVTSRWAQTTSNNIANANNASYARRDPTIVSGHSGGVTISEITQAVNTSLDSMYRLEVSRTATQDAIATGLSLYTAQLGDTGSDVTLLTQLTDFQNALGLMAASPTDSSLQRAALTDAQELTLSLNLASNSLIDAREQALSSAQNDITSINTTLADLAKMNEKLASGKLSEGQKLALGDEITAKLDSLAEKMDFTMRTDAKGRMEIFTTGGTALLLGETAETISFDAETGVLSAGAVDITPGAAGARGIGEGSLAGQITLYNDVIPEMSAQLDEVAKGLISVFETSDVSLAPGEAGLFTDAGAALSDPVAAGLAARIAVNSALVPDEGGAVWRFRDGVGATVQGESNDASQLNAFVDAMAGKTSFDARLGLADSATLADYMASLIASQNTTRANAETGAETSAAAALTVQETRLGFMGVNVDDELQQLVAIEQAYSANAQVMTTVMSMLDTLLDSF
ncbi:flagellar hook-associated protein FlgK [Salipiger mangrovisoli]|uniref:Flagellar hook-associated protein 1 n=1 Tax=Salipiger mangrovisoli TaxID=2865933 RepID=A0ABR9X0Q6_9RHOB|nr:flagellar hook-associated protein FlgK [Salipiger mangrovisoli]MBE9637135.1 flagellar hook-associated protein FlgK [Salipiger mangrovisoli]